MKTSDRTQRAPRSDAARRAQLLAAFDRSGLSAAAFARQHRLNYTTFCNWRQRRAQARRSPGFVEVELPSPTAPSGLTIDLGASVRLHVPGAGQIALAAELIRALQAKVPC